ncbi:S8 family peptidase [Amycolatopsis aidingensis]|uniref:S8 family peptidase n=1 Tax=Amycolatopsis aidingensis TaxID=2842453 RepID=UPI001C0A9618|nr:S8 family peptidase [Amycolatopsis aidingensis]
MQVRKRRSRPAAAVLAATTALVLGMAQPAGAEGGRAQAPSQAQLEQQSVTLITGDRVLMRAGQPTGHLVAGPGREDITFTTFAADGHTYVVPSDAAPLIGTGVLDRRLFDVTTLVRSGYADAERDSLPLLVTYADAPAAAGTMSAAEGTRITRRLPSIDGAAVRAEKDSATALWDSITGAPGSMTTFDGGVRRVWLDGLRSTALDRSVPQIGAPAAWEAGYTGAGTTIAVLDTGVDQTHPDLAERETAERNFTDAEDGADHVGHGTHVASIAAGTGAKSGGTYRGVAPEADILDGKVLGDSGSGRESWIIAGMEWAAEQGADIANLSLGGGDSAEIDPLEEAVNSLSAEHGTLFVIAAGNSGPASTTVGSPGTADAALTVGAVDREDEIAPFSSRGPRLGDGGIKPDITGPGVGIVAALHSDGTIGEPVEDGYTALSGTSMATPHVAGAAALLAQQHPGLSGAQLKRLLMASATPTEGASVFAQGAGRVDSAAALTQTVTAQPAGVNLGVQRWPHDDDTPVGKEVTFANSGTEEVTLRLEVEATGPAGKPAPEGLFTLSATEVTVPAGGTAGVTVTGDTRAAALDGSYSGSLVATAGEATVRTPLAINREVESYDLTLNAFDREGARTGQFSAFLFGFADNRLRFPYAEDGSVTLRVPKGEYLLQGTVQSGEPGTTADLLAYPKLTVDGDLAVDLDARRTKPVEIAAPQDSARPLLTEVSYTRRVHDSSFGSGFVALGEGLERLGTAHLGPQLPPAELTALVSSQWLTEPAGEYYGLAWYEYGRVPTGLTKQVRPEDLATVRTSYGPIPDGLRGVAGATPSPHLQPGGAWGTLIEIPESGPRIAHFTAEGVDWNRTLFLEDAESRRLHSRFESPPRSYQAGREYTESVNRAVFGPVMPESRFPYSWVIRDGDRITAQVPLFGDAAGNAGYSATDSYSLRLYRDGEEVEPERGVFEVEPGTAGFRLTAEATRSNAELSTRVSAAWTFDSDTTDRPSRLPVSTIRFFPDLDDANSAPGGRTFVFPVAVQEQGSPVTKVPHRLSAEVSYDGGQTWRPAGVLGNSQLVVQHPAGADTVSLRAKATDGNGNTVEHTIINAYKLR